MVTPTTIPAEAGLDSPPAEPESSPAVEDSSGDGPLIPANAPTEEMVVAEPAPEASEAPASKQPEGGEPRVQPEAGKGEARPGVGDAPGGTRKDTDYNAQESTYRKKFQELSDIASQANDRATRAEQLFGQQSTAREVEGYRQSLVGTFENMGVEKPEDLANQFTNVTHQAFQLDQENQALKAQLTSLTTQNTGIATQAIVLQISEQLGLTKPEDRAEMLEARSPEHARAIGQRIVDSNAYRRAQTKAKQAEVPAATAETAMDAGGGDATETDAQFELRLSQIADFSARSDDDRGRLDRIQAARA
jgi:hypothetical protein